MRGKFIIVDGVDGSGKTTLINKLFTHLTNKGHKVSANVKAIGSGLIGEAIREILIKPTVAGQATEGQAMDSAVELSLFITAYLDAVNSVVEPLIDQGINVIMDRSHVSMLVYQVLGAPEERRESMLQMFGAGLDQALVSPDILIWTTCSLAQARSNLEYRNADNNNYDKRLSQKLIDDYGYAIELVGEDSFPPIVIEQQTGYAIAKKEYPRLCDLIEQIIRDDSHVLTNSFPDFILE